MITLLAVLEYDGSAFFGSQSQGELPSVARLVEEALRSVGVFSKPRFSGRTDRGVHATRQAVCFELPYACEDRERLRRELNKKLAPHARLRRLERVRRGLDPRREAKNRAYRYITIPHEVSAFQSRYVAGVRLGEIARIREAMERLKGRHDFALFKKNGSETRTTIREIYRCGLYQHGERWIFYFEGSGFLRLQIRLLVGALIEVGQGKMSLEAFKEQLENRVRHAHIPAPASGLYLCKVGFYQDIWEESHRDD